MAVLGLLAIGDGLGCWYQRGVEGIVRGELPYYIGDYGAVTAWGFW